MTNSGDLRPPPEPNATMPVPVPVMKRPGVQVAVAFALAVVIVTVVAWLQSIDPAPAPAVDETDGVVRHGDQAIISLVEAVNGGAFIALATIGIVALLRRRARRREVEYRTLETVVMFLGGFAIVTWTAWVSTTW